MLPFFQEPFLAIFKVKFIIFLGGGGQYQVITHFVFCLGFSQTFCLGNQEDAHEFMMFLLDAMHKSTVQGYGYVSLVFINVWGE